MDPQLLRLSELPSALLWHVLTALDSLSLCQAARVSSSLRELALECFNDRLNDLLDASSCPRLDLAPAQSMKHHMQLLKLDSLEWVPAKSVLPTPRFAHSLVTYFDALVLFGGRNGDVCYNDTLELRVGSPDGEWKVLPTQGQPPHPRRAHSASVLGDSMYIIGGGSHAIHSLGDVHALDLVSLHWRSCPSCAEDWAYLGHTSTAVLDKLYVFGGAWWGCPGRPFHACSRLLLYDPHADSWLEPATQGSLPTPCYRHSSCLVRGSLLIWGGYTTQEMQHHGRLMMNCNAVHLLDTTTLHWSQPQIQKGPAPPPRGGQSCCKVGDQLLLFGGGALLLKGNQRHEVDFNDAWILDLTTWKYRPVRPLGPTPGPRGGHSMVLTQHDSQLCMLLCGGRHFHETRVLGYPEEVHAGRQDIFMLRLVDQDARQATAFRRLRHLLTIAVSRSRHHPKKK